ncbi:transglycosylase domain-containing protein [Ramlibacter sp.]|uniref:penicillin-binding protein 1A n=1 Tax=Ramlibacter sp. TaxID=1917967 RepID=UPI0017A8ADA1|nr:transglycosylase domain-containing protein [Ramlibacter sp.]MBA2674682.1 transglycosylase domain-containing protein [Ramlibacter sp.]
MKASARSLALASGAGLRRAGAAIRRHPIVSIAVLPVLALLYVLALIPFTPAIADLKKAKSEQPTIVLSADGKELASFKRANRDWVKLEDMSPDVVEALVATEDKRFYQHHGLDLRRTAGALVNTVRGTRQGGSTLTQQLARNLYPEDIGRAPTITRKLKEAITAVKIEAVYSKKEILETYLNTVPFLYNAWGIEMAARTYFDKSARQLDVLEAATLVGMLKGTSYYNPVLNPERALERRNIVLAQMARADKIAPGKLEELRKKPLKLDFERQQPEALGPAPHLAQAVRRWLIEWADRNGYDIYTDGLVVRTTIDSRLQAVANQAVERQADKIQQLATAAYGSWTANRRMADVFVRETADYRTARDSGLDDEAALKKITADAAFMQALWRAKTQVQAGFLALDPGTGQVRAWVGSRDFQQDQFDHVQQARRQPGSTFKPFVYGAAFEQGISPDQVFMDAPVEIRIDRSQVWRPTDVEPPTNQPMSLRDGLAFSKNTVTAQLMQQVGPARVAQLAQAMGVRQSKLDAVPSLALGTSPVTLREMVSAFGTIANGGSYIAPSFVMRVEDRQQRVLEEFQPGSGERALSSEAALTLVDVLRGVVDKGTGVGLRSRFGIKADIAAKTGTTQDNTDGWFIAMHPHLVTGAWMGFNDNRVTLRDPWGQGAHNALHIVGDFLQQSFSAKTLDADARFATPVRAQPGAGGDMWGRVGEWWNSVTNNGSGAPMPGDPMTAGVPQPQVITVPDVRQPEPMRLPEAEAQQSGSPVSPGGSVVVSGPNGGVGNSVVQTQPQTRYSGNAPVIVMPPRDTTIPAGSMRTITIDAPPSRSSSADAPAQQQETSGTATGSPTAPQTE